LERQADPCQSIEEFLAEPEKLKQYSLILVTSPSKILGGLTEAVTDARSHSIPLFYIHSNGFYSQFSVQLPEEFPIVDTHPDPASTQDLRLLTPWPELYAFVRAKVNNLEKLSDHDHGHVPYLVLLLHYLELWKASHDGKYPKSYAQKSEFRSMVRSGARTNNSEGGEENFDEAVGAVLKSLNPPSISSGLREVFEAPSCKNPTVDVSFQQSPELESAT
jgi:amyloid beta precursor protein binding protein 1